MEWSLVLQQWDNDPIHEQVKLNTLPNNKYALDKPASESKAMILSPSVLLVLSATPFCWGLFLTECCLAIPHSVKYASNSLDMYSFSPFVLS
jgi:hypothetical protein